ncbi:MAG: hypothetical protein ACLP56_20690, partial [Candidatus Sulfotelmatobacter sp.]
FAARQHALADHPGQPLDAGTLSNLKQAAPSARAPVNVVSPGYPKNGGGQSSPGNELRKPAPGQTGPAMQPSRQPASGQAGTASQPSRQPARGQSGPAMQPSRQPASGQSGPSMQPSRQPAKGQPGPAMQPSKQPQPGSKPKSPLLLDQNGTQ